MSDYADLLNGTAGPRLVCPQTHQGLELATEDLLARLREELAGGRLRNRAGEVLQGTLTTAFVREDGAVAYPVIDDLPILIVEGAIPLDERS